MIRAEHLQSREHTHATELLPWYVNGTLRHHDYETVKKHVAICSQCSREQARLTSLQLTIRDDAPIAVTAKSVVPFDALSARIDRQESAVRSRRSYRGEFWNEFKVQIQSIPTAVKWACALQSGALVLLCIVLIQSNAQHRDEILYHTVSDPEPGVPLSGETFQVVFAQGSAETEIRALLLSLSGQIVGGPSAHGVYTVAPNGTPGETSDSTLMLEQLRASDIVDLAEPLH